jgi:hypothetical protein
MRPQNVPLSCILVLSSAIDGHRNQQDPTPLFAALTDDQAACEPSNFRSKIKTEISAKFMARGFRNGDKETRSSGTHFLLASRAARSGCGKSIPPVACQRRAMSGWFQRGMVGRSFGIIDAKGKDNDVQTYIDDAQTNAKCGFIWVAYPRDGREAMECRKA